VIFFTQTLACVVVGDRGYFVESESIKLFSVAALLLTA